jgi:hypothetical protein
VIGKISAPRGRRAASGCRLDIVYTWWPILRMLQAAGLDKALDIADSTTQLIRQGTRSPRAMAGGDRR